MRRTVAEMAKKAKSLAVQYHGYLDACEKNDDSGVLIWGTSLLETQEFLGVALVDAKATARRIERVRKELK